jgi:hypothetical protein
MKSLIPVLCLILLAGCIEPTEPYTPTTGSGGYKLVAKLPTKGNAQDVVVNGDYAYLAQGEGGLIVFDISDPENPREAAVEFYDLRGYAYKIEYYSNAVYLAAGSYGISVVDVANPLDPFVEANNLEMKPARDVAIYKRFLFTGISEQGVKIADISDPTHPDIRGRIKTLPGYSRGMAFYKDSLLVVACGEMGLSLVNISTLQDGFEEFNLLSWLDTPGYAEAVDIIEDKKLALIAAGTGGLQIVDFSEPQNLKLVASYDEGGYAKEVVYRDNRIYLTTEKNGFFVLEIDDYSNIRKVAWLETSDSRGLDVQDNYIYIADDIDGFLVIEKP